jgi:hypothetical protein
MSDRSIAGAWNAAALDLDIRVTAPAQLKVGDRVEEVDAVIADFGSRGGTAAVRLHTLTAEVQEIAEALGMFVSQLASEAYGEYDRSLFIDTLNDWGWFGAEGQAPTWLDPTPWG